jgi:hypothetical protein
MDTLSHVRDFYHKSNSNSFKGCVCVCVCVCVRERERERRGRRERELVLWGDHSDTEWRMDGGRSGRLTGSQSWHCIARGGSILAFPVGRTMYSDDLESLVVHLLHPCPYQGSWTSFGTHNWGPLMAPQLPGHPGNVASRCRQHSILHSRQDQTVKFWESNTRHVHMYTYI